MTVVAAGMVAVSPFYPAGPDPLRPVREFQGAPALRVHPIHRRGHDHRYINQQRASAGPVEPTQPVRLLVPSLAIDAAVVPIPLQSDGVLLPPSDYREVGFWDGSAQPGMHFGQTVITGHTVHYGGGAFDHVGAVRHGQRVEIVTLRGALRYRVTRVKVYSKALITQKAVSIFGQTPSASAHQGRLVLITCTDYNGYEYLSNVVVFARLVGSSPTSAV